MLDRCRLPTHQAWHNYGARGISVCERWRQGFQNFWDDTGPGYRQGLTLERIDVNGNYTPENCTWATMKAQARNRRDNRIIGTIFGDITVAEAAERSGINYTTILYRLDQGWPDSMLLIPPDFTNRL